MPEQFQQIIGVVSVVIGVIGVFKAFTAAHEFLKNQSQGRPSEGTEWAQFGDAILFAVVGFSGFISGLFALVPTL